VREILTAMTPARQRAEEMKAPAENGRGFFYGETSGRRKNI